MYDINLNMDRDDRAAVSRIVMQILDNWDLEPEEKIHLLALPGDIKPRMLRRYYEGTPLPETPEVNERIEHLLGIADALRTSYPCNAAAGAIWLRQKNSRFEDRPPLLAMLEDGMGSIFAVRAFLDCAWDWNMSGSRRA
jgi:hypothetical protein